MPKKGEEIIDVEVQVEHETLKAWLVTSFITHRKAWIAKSMGELDAPETGNRVGTLTLSTKIAQEKELI